MGMTKRHWIIAVLAGAMGLAGIGRAERAWGKYDPFGAGSSDAAGRSVNRISSVEFVDTPITTVFRMISDLTGWSILMSPEVSKSPPKINLWIKDLSAGEVLDELVLLGELVVQREGTTVQVMTFDEYGRLYGMEKKVITLRHCVASEVAALLTPFIEKSHRAQLIADDRGRRLILLIPAPLLESLEKLIHSVDQPLEYDGDTVEVVPLQYRNAAEMLQPLREFLQGASSSTAASHTPANKIVNSPSTPAGASSQAFLSQAPLPPAGSDYLVRFLVEPKLNVLVLRGLKRDVEKTRQLIIQLDQPGELTLAAYGLENTDAAEAYETLANLLDEESQRGRNAPASGNESRRLRVALSKQNSRILAIGSPRDQLHLAELIAAIDQPLPAGSGGIRVYRLENTTADAAAQVIQSLIDSTYSQDDKARSRRLELFSAAKDGVRRVELPSSKPGDLPAAAEKIAAGGPSGSSEGLPPSVIAAAEINAVVIRASASQHAELETLIEELDRPRDQVMLEVTMVTVRSTENFDLGIEMGGAMLNRSGVNQVGFTAYGIGQVDSSSGAVRLGAQAPFGLNYALFNSDDFSLVLNALETVGTTTITSSPQLVVENNSSAQISQINQEPFEVTSQGESTTMTSFGGYADAGTQLSVIPYLSQEDWLRLRYEIMLSSFGERVNESLPPPRYQNALTGTVRIPAEHTVVLGGLIGRRKQNSLRGVPWVSDIPLLGELFKNRSREEFNETLFVFVRPILLRNRDFEDLKWLSRRDLKKAHLPSEQEPRNEFKLWSFEEASN
jgi:type II secretory pathway component GspD/PulD (secretin)